MLATCRAQLTARGQDVAPAWRPNGRSKSSIHDDLRKALDRAFAAGLERAVRPWVERDQVDLRGHAGDQAHKFARISLAVVHPLQHDVLEGDPPCVGRARITAARGYQL